MSKQVQFRRGTTADHSAFTGAAGEITVDTTKNTAVVHDGATAGGNPLARAGANTDITSVLLSQTGLVVKGATANALTIKPNETLGASRTLNIVTGDSDRTLTFAGNATVSGTNTGDQTIPLGFPQGRLSFSTGVAAHTTTVSGATSVYYTPYTGLYVPIYNGSTWTTTSIGSELSQTAADSTKSPAATAPCCLYNMYVWSDSGTMRCTRGPALSRTNATVTMTIASPCVVSWTSHGLRQGDPVIFTTSGALPTGITAGNVYWVIAAGYGANSFRISATKPSTSGDGSAVNTSGSQSGTHTCTVGWTGDPSSELTKTDGVYLNTSSITNGPTASRGTWVGVIASNESSTFDFTFASLAAKSGAGFIGIWNAYNRVPVSMFTADSTDTWTYTTATWRPSGGSSTACFRFLIGIAADSWRATTMQRAANGTGQGSWAIGYDSQTAPATNSTINLSSTTATFGLQADWCAVPAAGCHWVAPLEYSSAAGTTTWYGDGGGTNLQTGATISGFY